MDDLPQWKRLKRQQELQSLAESTKLGPRNVRHLLQHHGATAPMLRYDDPEQQAAFARELGLEGDAELLDVFANDFTRPGPAVISGFDYVEGFSVLCDGASKMLPEKVGFLFQFYDAEGTGALTREACTTMLSEHCLTKAVREADSRAESRLYTYVKKEWRASCGETASCAEVAAIVSGAPEGNPLRELTPNPATLLAITRERAEEQVLLPIASSWLPSEMPAPKETCSGYAKTSMFNKACKHCGRPGKAHAP